MPVRKHKSSITFAERKFAADTKVVIQQTLELEDEFGGMYDMHKTNAAIMPPFNPLVLKRLCQKNNILQQCIHAMETNIDGTGYEIADDSQEGKPKGIDPATQLAMAQAHGETEGPPGSPVDPLKLLDKLRGVTHAGTPPATKPNPFGGSTAAPSETATVNAAAAAAGVAGATKPNPVAAATAAAQVEAGKPNVVPFGKKTSPVDPNGDPNQAPDPNDPNAKARQLPGGTDPALADPNSPPPVDPNADTPQEAAEKEMLDAFFKEPFPNESFIAIRRKLRADIEATGNGYMEVIRNVAGEVVFLRHLDSSTMRLVRLDNAIPVEREIDRGGTKFKATIYVRERRYVQRVGTQYLYYKEFGSERELDRDDGGWLDDKGSKTGIPPTGAASPGNKPAQTSTPILSMKADTKSNAQSKMDGASVAPGPANAASGQENRFDAKPTMNFASEVLHFICDKDATTPYGVPRWINNLPAVVGSRKAEEFNLGFFDAGGLPPAIVFIQGGALASSVKEQLLAYLSGGPENKYRAAVVEAQSSSGSLDSAGQVKVTVERFGDTSQKDSMFQDYDLKCEDHVRGAFRMPAIFLGKAQDYNFATALTAVMVTEAQVFAPERMEFDERINHTIVRALGAVKYKFKSLPITLKNADLQLKALPIAAPKIDGQDLIDTINKITGLSLSFSATAEKASTALNMAQAAKSAAQAQSGGFPPGKGGDPAAAGSGKPNPFAPGLGASSDGETAGGMGSGSGMRSVALKSDLSSNDIVLLAGEWANAIGLADGPRLDKDMRRAIVTKVESLPSEQRKLFNSVVASATFTRSSFDQEGLSELAGCCVGLMDHAH